MAFYVHGEKVEETNEFVIYKYGDDYKVMPGLFKYYKDPFNVDILKNYHTGNNKNCQLAFRLCSSIRNYLKENGYYPDKISYCSG